MRHYVFCISGYSGTGKDEVAGHLIRSYKAVQTGLADPAKRHMADVYGFTEEQLFGPSSARNKGDPRYPKEAFFKYGLKKPATWNYGTPIPLEFVGDENKYLDLPGLKGGPLKAGMDYWVCEGRNIPEAEVTTRPCKLPGLPRQPLKLGNARYFVPEGDARFWLCPREPLQDYCELMNNMYLRTWSRKGMEIHRQLSEVHRQDGNAYFFRNSYDRMRGVVPNDPDDGENWRETDNTFISCFADFRHWHEVKEANDVEGLTTVLVRVKRPSVPDPPYDHRSEKEQAEIPDSMFDFVLKNDGTFDDLYAKVDGMVADVKNPRWSSNRRRL